MTRPQSRPRSKTRSKPVYFRSSEIPPGARGFRARNGIAAKLFHYMTHSRKFRQADQALTVAVPHTTTAEMFRIHILNYMRSRKNPLLVSTSVKSATEILVWLRDAGTGTSTRPRKVSVPFEPEIETDTDLELGPLWPPGSDEEYFEYADDNAEDGVDEDGTPIIYV